MPNYVYNKLRITGKAKDIKEFNEFIGERFDFNKITRMPDIIKNTGSGNNIINGIKVDKWYVDKSLGTWEEQRKSERQFTENELEQLKKIGFYNWYDWSIANWGTKWNAINASIKKGKTLTIIEFETAWSYPAPIISKIAAMFPNLQIKLTYRDEGWTLKETETILYNYGK